MSLNLRHILPLSDFQRSAKSFLATLKETQSPMLLTVNGKAAVVIQDAERYQRLMERMELLESMAGIRQSLEEFDQGKGIPLNTAFQQLREQHDIPDWTFTYSHYRYWRYFSLDQSWFRRSGISMDEGMLWNYVDSRKISQSVSPSRWKSIDETACTPNALRKAHPDFVYGAGRVGWWSAGSCPNPSSSPRIPRSLTRPIAIAWWSRWLRVRNYLVCLQYAIIAPYISQRKAIAFCQTLWDIKSVDYVSHHNENDN